jgi:hypothetical protein
LKPLHGFRALFINAALEAGASLGTVAPSSICATDLMPS